MRFWRLAMRGHGETLVSPIFTRAFALQRFRAYPLMDDETVEVQRMDRKRWVTIHSRSYVAPAVPVADAAA